MGPKMPAGWRARLLELGDLVEAGHWEVLSSLDGSGPVAQMEAAAVEYFGGRWALGVTNATSALIAALHAGGVKRGDEVIVPAFTWPQTIFPVLVLGARPVFVDCSEASVTIDPEAVREAVTERTSAIVAAHLYGYSADVTVLREIADERHLLFVIDAAQGSGIRYDHGKLADFADFTALSFGRGKILSVGEGGILMGRSPRLADRALLSCQHPLRVWRDARDSRIIRAATGLNFNFRIHPFVAALIELAIQEAARTVHSYDMPQSEEYPGVRFDRPIPGSYLGDGVVTGMCRNPHVREACLSDGAGRFGDGGLGIPAFGLVGTVEESPWHHPFSSTQAHPECPNAVSRANLGVTMRLDKEAATPDRKTQQIA